MGRQAYLTRLALGRSAFEPPEPGPFTAPRDASPGAEQSVDGLGHYVQRYDERGHPINLSSRAYGRALRQAQNDVLAAIGVLERERKRSESSTAEPNPLNEEQLIQRLKDEDTYGDQSDIVILLLKDVGTWSLGSFTDRLLTFRAPRDLPLLQLLHDDYGESGVWRFCFAGLPANLLYTVVPFQSYFAARFLDLLLLRTHVPRTKSKWIRRVLESLVSAAVHVAYAPLLYYPVLQRLHLLPSRPLFPPWTAFVPFSALSPIRPVSLPSELTVRTFGSLVASLLTQPLFIVFLQHYIYESSYGVYANALRTTITQPDKGHLYSSEKPLHQGGGISPAFVKRIVRRLLIAIGWAQPLAKPTASPRRAQGHPTGGNHASSIVDGAAQNTPRSDSDQPNGNTGNNEAATNSLAQGQDQADHVPPVPEILNQGVSQATDQIVALRTEPRVRVTDDNDGLRTIEIEYPIPEPSQESPPKQHRVTSLSKAPARMLVTLLAGHLANWTVLPLKLIGLRLIASQFLQSSGIAFPDALLSRPWVSVRPAPSAGLRYSIATLGLRSAGGFAGQLVLCGALQLAVDLGLWGCHWMIVTWAGRKFFGWGRL